MRVATIHWLRRPRLRERYVEGRTESPLIERLTDEDLNRLNELLPWRCFTVDRDGRPFGGVAWRGKRATPQVIPDPRIQLFHERFDLSDKHVLELGCFEGIHTIALCRLAERVTAVDARVENVVKTAVRCAFFDERPRVFVYDVESKDEDGGVLGADLCHHVGVLYHLQDPVAHLRRLGTWISCGLMLDTHYARDEESMDEYTVNGEQFRFRPYEEMGRNDAFSGMRPTSKWLRLDDIVTVLRDAGFDSVDVVETREERNGPRALLFAERTTAFAAPTRSQATRASRRAPASQGGAS
jgi:2-polyprenyl-3-methyl-5-hydroxy-6-metoxy-1,4-benzoquinol methylase